jgi:hypothetical protein
MIKNILPEELDRFNSKWTEAGDCHLWTGPLDKDGYGTFYFKKKNRRAHRVAYYLLNGAIPDGMVIDHICKNRHCVAPSHLRCVTVRENILTNSRSVSAQNAMKTHCKRGHLFDRVYSKQRYCSVCEKLKSERLRKKWKAAADSVRC